VLLDPVGSGRWTRSVLARLADAGVHARATLPFRLLRARTRRDMRSHRKLFSIDDRLGIIGSSNVDIRSFQLNQEISLLLLNAPTVALLKSVHDGYIAASTELNLEDWRRRSRLAHLSENAPRLVSPLL